MDLRGKLLQQLLLGVVIFATTGASITNSTSCERMCGKIKIPYPFGTSEGCYLDKPFLITCNHTFVPPKPFLDVDLPVEDISVPNGELRVSNHVAHLCKRDLHSDQNTAALLNLSSFRISGTRNKITAVGCDVYTYINGTEGQKGFTTGCLSLCDPNLTVVNGSCSGIGCCQTSIPEGTTGYILNVRSLSNDTLPGGKDHCGYGFIVDKQAYKFSSLDFRNLKNSTTVPLVLDWTIGNKTCKDAQKNKGSYACKATHSYCYDSTNGPGYRCNCSSGYQGNPYLPDGQDDSCQDIDECKLVHWKLDCNAIATCINTDGNYTCTCPMGYEGDGRIDGTDCRPIVGQSNNKISSIAWGASAGGLGVLFLLIGGGVSYKVVKKRKRIERRKEFFKRNGGQLLQQQISQSELNVENTKLFNSKELEKATDHFNVNRILGQGGQGTVYKAMLDDGRIVAVKKSKITDEGKLQEFINEVVVLSRINHTNIVKLLGCCLETEVPLLVYEFVPNGTLSKYLSDQTEEFPLTWNMRLRIATEIAGALYYLHSAGASLPIYHRDIKSTNILLDEKYRAKVADFGTSRFIAIDQTHLTTLVHGTFGYLDPEYFQSSKFTEKSDVYSFGVVLVELFVMRWLEF